MNIPVYNIERKQVEEINVSDALFRTPWKPALVHQVVITQQANSRQRTALVKNRGDVQGGGKKPWKQKGTGRARHGSIRSPLWIGGGVTHGPTAERSFEKKINKKMKLTALLSLISRKFKDGKVFVVDGISQDTFAKTKDVSEKTKSFRKEFGTIALITSSQDKKVFFASRNIPKLLCIAAKSMNIVDLTRPNAIIIVKQAIPEITSHFIRTKNKELETDTKKES